MQTYRHSPLARPLIERRLFRYAGTRHCVLRWFIATDAVPFAYITPAAAAAELQRRQADGINRGKLA